MKARKQQTNLNSSTSSLDSALCMDSASSMEPSPVSSASSSFSPAPSTTTRSSGSTVSTSSSSLSQPEDMKKVNEKLISTLATERLIAADSANKARGEGSPTSTNSSTSTLKGDESAENIPGLVQDQSGSTTSKREASVSDSSVTKEPLAKKDSTDSAVVTCHSHSFDGPLVVTRTTYGREPLLSDSDKSPSIERRSKTPVSYSTSINTSDPKDYLSRSYTIDLRRDKGGTKSGDREATFTSSGTWGRSSRGMSKQKAEDLLALDPKTIQSLEKLKKLTAHKRPKTPEPLAPALSDVKLLHSPERRRRRKSEGMHPIEKQAGSNFKPVENTLHEGDESGDEHSKSKEVNEKVAPVSVSVSKESDKLAEDRDKYTFKPIIDDVAPTCAAHDVESKKIDRKVEDTSTKNEVSSSKRVSSPSAKTEEVSGSKRVTSPDSTTKKEEVLESVRIPSPVKGSPRTVSPRPSEAERKAPTPGSSSRRTSSKEENGDRSPSPKKRISSSSSNEEIKPVGISAFTRSTPVDRMWSDFKKEDDGLSKVRTSPRSSRYQNSSNSSPSLINEDSPTHNRRRFVTREKFLDDGRSSFKLKPSSQQRSTETSPRTSRSSSPTKAPQRGETKASPETVTKSPTPLEKEKEPAAARTKTPPRTESPTAGRTKSPPVISVNGNNKKGVPKAEGIKSDSKSEDAPAISVQPPSVSESKGQSTSTSPISGGNHLQENRSPRDVCVRQKSPVSERYKVIKANRRKTPVISEDALAAILSGDIPDDDFFDENGMCPLSPSQIGERRMTLETCPEEDEEPAAGGKQQFISPARKNILKQSSLDQTSSPQRSPEKKVTINSEPCIRRVGRKPMLSAEMRERTKSLTSFSPERSLSPTSPDYAAIPEEADSLSKSSILPVGRFRASSLVMSQSTPDLSEILGPKKKDRKARRIERSNSKRRVRVDSYVTSTTPNSTFNPAGSFTGTRSSSRRLSGSGSRLSKLAAVFSRKDKDNSENDSRNRQTEKSSKRS